jgi:hypothetical protein
MKEFKEYLEAVNKRDLSHVSMGGLRKALTAILHGDSQGLSKSDKEKAEKLDLMDDESFNLQLKKFIKSNWNLKELKITDRELDKRIKLALKYYDITT